MTKQSDMAQKILDTIHAKPEAFNMGNFVNRPEWVNIYDWHLVDSLPSVVPGEEISCGTTMCVFGWAALFDGYTLGIKGATKDGELVNTETAGAIGLDLAEDAGVNLAYVGEETATRCLERMAAGEAYSQALLEQCSDQVRLEGMVASWEDGE